MVKKNKRLQKARENIKGVTYRELEQILYDAGFQFERSSGSHNVFSVMVNQTKFTYPLPKHGKEVKPNYVRDLLDVVEQVYVERAKDQSDG
jgi:predicted RNA binding protein YcfA (HicA-like mRNA interferase family)